MLNILTIVVDLLERKDLLKEDEGNTRALKV